MVFNGIEIYNYLVIFHGEVAEDYSPVLPMKEIDTFEYQRTVHLLTPDLVDVLDTLEFILHLPRLSLDLYNQDELLIDSSYDTPHCIIPLPDSFLVKNPHLKLDITGIFLSDNCVNEAFKAAEAMNIPLGHYRQSDLSSRVPVTVNIDCQ